MRVHRDHCDARIAQLAEISFLDRRNIHDDGFGANTLDLAKGLLEIFVAAGRMIGSDPFMAAAFEGGGEKVRFQDGEKMSGSATALESGGELGTSPKTLPTSACRGIDTKENGCASHLRIP
jgi:hypothetical protein